MKRKVLIAVIALAIILAIAIPWSAHYRAEANRTACIYRLRQIDGAKGQWALEHLSPSATSISRETLDKIAPSNVVPTWDDIAYYGGRQSPDWGDHYPPRCPSGGTYSINRVADLPTCSFPGHVLTP